LHAGAVAALAVWALGWPAWAGGPAAEAGSVPGGTRGHDGIRLASARSLLRAGDVQRALKEAVRARELFADSPELDVLLGDICYRRADFEAAARYYTRATQSDPACAQAHLGLGRIDQVQCRRRSARRNFAKAYSLNPDDPEVVRAYAGAATTRRDEIALLRRYLNVGRGEPRQLLESAVSRIEIDQRLGARELTMLDGPYAQYRLAVTPWRPTGGFASGVLLKVSVNDSRPLRLAFDTGASGIYMSAKAAAKLGLENLSEAAIGGLAGAGLVKGRLALARTVRIGDLLFRNCPIHLMEEPAVPFADGVIGVGLFERFLLRLDARRGTLDLLPYPEAPEEESGDRPWNNWDRTVPPGMESFVPLCRVGHLALIPTRINGVSAGYFLLDTGAAYSSLSKEVTEVAAPAAETSRIALAAVGRGLAGSSLLGAVRFQFAGRELADGAVAAFDFRPISNLHGVEISGLIGYPLLSRSAVTINYRDGLFGMDK